MCLFKNSVQYWSKNVYRNVLVFKSLSSDNSSEYKDFQYYKGVLNTEDLFIHDERKLIEANKLIDEPENCVTHGFHFRSNSGFFHRTEKTHLFLVPKGSYVWFGFENFKENYFGGVSNQIIYLGRNNWFNRLYYKWVYKAIIL